MVDNEYGVEFDWIEIKQLRVNRTDGKWLVEYRREPRRLAFWDKWWWYNDGIYSEYTDALDRIKVLKNNKAVKGFPRFQKVSTIIVE